MIQKLTNDEIQAKINECSDDNYKEVKQTIQNHLTEYIKNEKFTLDDTDLKERLYKMIDYAIGRFDYYSDQKHKFLTLGLSFIGISVTFIGILLSNGTSINEFIKFCGYLGFTILFFTGIIMVLFYNDYTTANYPYRKIMDIQSWFFKYKFSDNLDYNLSSTKKKADRQIYEVSTDYLKSIYNWVDKSKVKNYFIKEDIEQVAILQLLQKYGRDCVNKMKKTMNWGVGIFITILFMVLVKELLFYFWL